MDDGDGLVKLRALWGYRRGRLDFLIVLLHAAQVCVVFVHVRVAVPRRARRRAVASVAARVVGHSARPKRPVRDVVSSW